METRKPDTEDKPRGDAEEINERRRALVRAGWTVPVVASVSGLASNAAFAASPHNDGHGDVPEHVDAPHSDVHNDVPHDDAPHVDIHGDAPDRGHGDSHDDITVLHIDTPHIDSPIAHFPHLDTAFAHGDSHDDVAAF